MGTSALQPSFTGGEISPSLYARVDLARYATSLRTCRNWIVQRHGGVVTRPGFRFIAPAAGAACRLVEFTVSADESLLVEFSSAATRFFRAGALIPEWTLPSPYTAAQVARIAVAQVGAQMVLAHPEVAPRALRFVSQAAGFVFDVPVVGSPNTAAPLAPNVVPFDATTPTLLHSYVVTSVDSVTGVESIPSAATTIAMNLRADKPATVNTGIAFSGANVYRGRAGVYGFIGTTETQVFLDENVLPDYSNPPPQWTDPFVGAGNYPATVTHFQQRRWFGGTQNDPQTLRGSNASELRRFDAASPARDDDAIDATLAATMAQAIQHLVPLSRLIVLTARAEWVATAGDASVLTPNNTGFAAESAHGASEVAPVMTGEGAIYVQAQGTRVRDLVFNAQLQQFGGTDLTVLAAHLFEGYTITDLAWSAYPFSVVWAVRDDGVLLALTYLRDQEVWGWSQHHTDGAVERVCVVREGQQDVLYAVIRRAGVRLIEALTDRFPRDMARHVGLDASLSYDGRNTDPTRTVTLSTSSWGSDDLATLSFGLDGTPEGAGIGDEIHLHDADGVRLVTCQIESVVTLLQFRVALDRVVPVALRDTATAHWALAQRVFAGLVHLSGRTVTAVADGAVQDALVVQADGTVALRYAASVVHVGLPFTCTMETLDLSFPNAGTVRDKLKVIPRVTLYVEQSRGLTVSIPPADPVDVKQREFERYEDGVALFTGTFDVRTPATWETPGRVRVEQTFPLPATVLAIIPEVTLGG